MHYIPLYGVYMYIYIYTYLHNGCIKQICRITWFTKIIPLSQPTSEQQKRPPAEIMDGQVDRRFEIIMEYQEVSLDMELKSSYSEINVYDRNDYSTK